MLQSLFALTSNITVLFLIALYRIRAEMALLFQDLTHTWLESKNFGTNNFVLPGNFFIKTKHLLLYKFVLRLLMCLSFKRDASDAFL